MCWGGFSAASWRPTTRRARRSWATPSLPRTRPTRLRLSAPAHGPRPATGRPRAQMLTHASRPRTGLPSERAKHLGRLFSLLSVMIYSSSVSANVREGEGGVTDALHVAVVGDDGPARAHRGDGGCHRWC